MKTETLKRKRYNQCHMNGCDWYDCETCPHDECIADEEMADEWIKRQKELEHKRELKRYRKNRINGICTRCRKKQAVEGKTRCAECAEKSRLEAIEYRKKHPKPHKYVNPNLCFICRKKECYENHKVCYDCYQVRLRTINQARNSENYKIAHQKLSKENHNFFVK